jgi:hypothetical protein
MIGDVIDKYIHQRDLIHQPNPMFYSSFLFLTNVLIAYRNQYYVYSYLFFTLFTTSVIIHSHYTLFTNIIDKVSIIMVVSYGGYMFISKKPSLIKSVLIVSTFLGVIYLYIYGYYTNSLCFHEDQLTGRLYHSFMHLISSLGHHLIMLA